MKIADVGDYKSLISYDAKNSCISQVLSSMPSMPILLQSCFILSKLINSKGSNIIKDPTLLFLLLLAGTDQINEGLKKLGVHEDMTEVYFIKCCFKDLIVSERVKISKSDRLHLSYNAITFAAET